MIIGGETFPAPMDGPNCACYAVSLQRALRERTLLAGIHTQLFIKPKKVGGLKCVTTLLLITITTSAVVIMILIWKR